MTYRIGTRGSKLALVQTEMVKTRLAAAYPEEYSKAMTMKAARMMLCNERHIVRNLTYDGIMSKKDGDLMEDSIDTRSEKLM